jgi:hypothetical protein
MPEVMYAWVRVFSLWVLIFRCGNITFNCLIVPCGQLHALPRDKVVQTVTVGSWRT